MVKLEEQIRDTLIEAASEWDISPHSDYEAAIAHHKRMARQHENDSHYITQSHGKSDAYGRKLGNDEGRSLQAYHQKMAKSHYNVANVLADLITNRRIPGK